MANANSDEESTMQCSKSDETQCNEENLQGRLKYIMFTYDSIKDKWNKLASDMSKDDVLNSINRIYQYSLKSDEIERKAFIIEQKLKKSNTNVENEIEQLKQDIEQLEIKFDHIKNDPKPKKDNNDDDDEEIVVYLDPNAPEQVHHKIQFSNNIVRYLKGPLKLAVHGIMSAADLAAKGTHIDESFLEAVRKGLEKQKQKTNSKNNSLRPTFTEITSDWKVEGENEDKGFNSPSHWIRDPQGRRILIKIQPLPLCVANEWLAYALGKRLGLPVNEVQISLFENQLVTLHTDDQNEDEKTITFIDLPKQKEDILLANPIIEHMDIFDHIIQNVDRNLQNILLIIPKTVEIENDDYDHSKVPLKIRLIDHASSFGMGQMSGISEIAAKFHSDRLSVIKFDPMHKSKEFEDYLTNLPVEDRPIIIEILNRFASITDEEFNELMNEIQDFLSSSQHDRISNVLRRQRDIAKRFVDQWSTSS